MREYKSFTEVFLAQYGITPETKEISLKFLDDAESVQQMNKQRNEYMRKLETSIFLLIPGDRRAMLNA